MTDIRRQLFCDVFDFLDVNEHEFNTQIIDQLRSKLTLLWIENERSYKICRYWRRNQRCPFGNHCKFQHFAMVKSKTNCIFNKRHMCKYQENCLFTHNKDDKPYIFNHNNNNPTRMPLIPPHIFNKVMNNNQHTTTNIPTQPDTHFSSCCGHISQSKLSPHCVSCNQITTNQEIQSSESSIECNSNKLINNDIKSIAKLSIQDDINCFTLDNSNVNTHLVTSSLSIEDNINNVFVNSNPVAKSINLSIEDNINSITIDSFTNDNNNIALDNNKSNILNIQEKTNCFNVINNNKNDDETNNLENLELEDIDEIIDQENKNQMIKYLDDQFEDNIKKLDFEYNDEQSEFDIDNTSDNSDDQYFKLGASWGVTNPQSDQNDYEYDGDIKMDINCVRNTILDKIEESSELDNCILVHFEGNININQQFNIMFKGYNPFIDGSFNSFDNIISNLRITIFTTETYNLVIQLFEHPFDI